MTEFRPSYTTYVAQRVAVNLGRRLNDRSENAPVVVAASGPILPADLKPPVRSPMYQRIARDYLMARADDIVGDVDKAHARYAAIANIPEASLDDESLLLRRAAGKFASSHRTAVVPPAVP